MSRSASDGRVPVLLAVHSAVSGGAQAMALHEARHLAGRFRLVISIPRGPLREHFEPYGELVRCSPGVPTWRASPGRWLVQSVRTGCDALRLAVVIRRRGIRLVVTNSTVLLAPVLAARLARVPVIVHAREWPTSRLGRLVFTLHGLLADTVVAISGGVEARFHQARRARVVRIPDGIEIPPAPAPSPGHFHTPVRLCVVGAINADRGKGQDLAVEALALLRDRGIEATLDFVGRIGAPSFAEELRSMSRQRGLSDRVRILGERGDVPVLLAATDALLFCSRDGADVTPLVLMEALSHGRPVVATNVGSVPEVVIDGETGLLVPPGDPGAIAEAVAALVADPRRARDLAERGRRQIAARYDRRSGLERLCEEIERELSRSGA